MIIHRRFVKDEALFKLKTLSHFGETRQILTHPFTYSINILRVLNYASHCHSLEILWYIRQT